MEIQFNRRFNLIAPEGTISEAGIIAVTVCIQAQALTSDEWTTLNPNYNGFDLPRLPKDWDWTWVVSKGTYAGTLPKRIAKFYFKEHGIKCPEKFLSQIGNIGREHASQAVEYTFEFVNRIDWEAGDFGDEGSCFWGRGAIDMLNDNGGMAIRFFENGEGVGRAWLIDWASVYILFNGYGLAGNATLTAARVMALHLNATYKKIRLTNYGMTGGALWINNDGTAYAIGAPDMVEDIDTADLDWDDPDIIACSDCGDRVNEDETYTGADGEMYCQTCFYDRFDTCGRCGETHYRDDLYYTEDGDMCEYCLDRHYEHCVLCDEYRRKEMVHFYESEDKYLCERCRKPE